MSSSTTSVKALMREAKRRRESRAPRTIVAGTTPHVSLREARCADYDAETRALAAAGLIGGDDDDDDEDEAPE